MPCICVDVRVCARACMLQYASDACACCSIVVIYIYIYITWKIENEIKNSAINRQIDI
jgi:hypothetical protein